MIYKFLFLLSTIFYIGIQESYALSSSSQVDSIPWKWAALEKKIKNIEQKIKTQTSVHEVKNMIIDLDSDLYGPKDKGKGFLSSRYHSVGKKPSFKEKIFLDQLFRRYLALIAYVNNPYDLFQHPQAFLTEDISYLATLAMIYSSMARPTRTKFYLADKFFDELYKNIIIPPKRLKGRDIIIFATEKGGLGDIVAGFKIAQKVQQSFLDSHVKLRIITKDRIVMTKLISQTFPKVSFQIFKEKPSDNDEEYKEMFKSKPLLIIETPTRLFSRDFDRKSFGLEYSTAWLHIREYARWNEMGIVGAELKTDYDKIELFLREKAVMGLSPISIGVLVDPIKPKPTIEESEQIIAHLQNPFLKNIFKDPHAYLAQTNLYHSYFKNPYFPFASFLSAVVAKEKNVNKDMDIISTVNIFYFKDWINRLKPILIKFGIRKVAFVSKEEFIEEEIALQGKTLRIINPYPISHKDMKNIGRISDFFSGMTGDQSWSEAVSSNKFLFYEVVPFKEYFLPQYRDLARQIDSKGEGLIPLLDTIEKIKEIIGEKEWDARILDQVLNRLTELFRNPLIAKQVKELNLLIYQKYNAYPRIIAKIRRILAHSVQPELKKLENEILRSLPFPPLEKVKQLKELIRSKTLQEAA